MKLYTFSEIKRKFQFFFCLDLIYKFWKFCLPMTSTTALLPFTLRDHTIEFMFPMTFKYGKRVFFIPKPMRFKNLKLME